MTSKTFPVFDCDSHVVEPPEIWEDYVPSSVRDWIKTQFYFHTDSDVLHINGAVVPAARERTVVSEVWRPGLSKKIIGELMPGKGKWEEEIGRVAGARNPHSRLRDMDAIGVDQAMMFATWFVRLPLLKDPEAAHILVQAYNNWVYDYCGADRKRLYPCALLALQSVERSIEELRRVAKLGFKAAAVRPCLWGDKYPTLPEYDPLWREFEDLGVVLAMHTFPSREPMNQVWAQRIAKTMEGTGQGFMFGQEPVLYSPGQFVSNIVFSMDPSVDSSESLGFIFEAMTWLTTVLMSGWLQKFPRLKPAIMESNATWLPLVLSRSKSFLDLYTYLRKNPVRDPYEAFYEQCFIAFEGDEEPVARMWDVYENVGIWSSDYPHHDAEDVWEALDLMERNQVPKPVQEKLLGENARRLYDVEPLLVVTEPVKDYRPDKMPWQPV